MLTPHAQQALVTSENQILVYHSDYKASSHCTTLIYPLLQQNTPFSLYSPKRSHKLFPQPLDNTLNERTALESPFHYLPLQPQTLFLSLSSSSRTVHVSWNEESCCSPEVARLKRLKAVVTHIEKGKYTQGLQPLPSIRPRPSKLEENFLRIWKGAGWQWVAHAFNPSTPEAKAGGSLSLQS